MQPPPNPFTPDPCSKLLTPEELAKHLDVSVATIRAWGRSGRIPRIVVSPKVIRYEYARVIAALKEGGAE